MSSARPGRLGLALTVSLLLVVAAGGVVVGPRLAPALMTGDGALAKGKRKLQRLWAFALFRAPGDRAVLGTPDRRPAKHPAPKQ